MFQDIKKFIEESKHGVVYFCMGALLRSETFPEAKRNAFVNAFSKIPQRVLWKWEGKPFVDKSNKILMLEWMPQRDILGEYKDFMNYEDYFYGYNVGFLRCNVTLSQIASCNKCCLRWSYEA